MSILQAFLLGLVQGVTEFLPVSSSGHLLVIEAIMGHADTSLFFNLLLHVGSLLAIFFLLWREIASLFIAVFDVAHYKENKGELRFFLMLVVGTAVTAVIGLGIDHFHLADPGNLSLMYIAAFFCATAIMLFFTKGRGRYGRSTEDISIWQAFIVGLFQGVAALPGISRSGSTLFAGLNSGLSREAAYRFSFLLVIPAIIGGFVLELGHGAPTAGLGTTISVASLIAGFVGSLIASLLSLNLIHRLVRKNRLWYFGFYLIVAAAFTIVLAHNPQMMAS